MTTREELEAAVKAARADVIATDATERGFIAKVAALRRARNNLRAHRLEQSSEPCAECDGKGTFSSRQDVDDFIEWDCGYCDGWGANVVEPMDTEDAE